MSLLSRSTYSSICFLLFLHFVWLLLLAATAPGATAKPASMDAMTTTSNCTDTHIVSFVGGKDSRARAAFDSKRNEVEAQHAAMVHQLFGSLLQLQGQGNVSRATDDSLLSARNTLDDELSLDDVSLNEQHESSTEDPDAWRRIKLAIPVLEPVKHLLNAVGGGDVNDTHVRTNTHRLRGHTGVHHPHHNSSNSSSPAIETEEDRETAIDSTGFDLLETLGTVGTLIWGMLQNLRRLFAASAGNASTAFSGGGGGAAAAGGQ